MEENKKETLKLIGALILILLIAVSVPFWKTPEKWKIPEKEQATLERFDSCDALAKAFKEKPKYRRNIFEEAVGVMTTSVKTTALGATKAMAESAPEYSETNIQVAGVDEADIVKTDGKYIYTVINGKLVIAKAFPVEDAEVLSKTTLYGSPIEMFIDENRVLIFGREYTGGRTPNEPIIQVYNINMLTAQLWDVSDRKEPELVKSFDFEGNYVSSRKIGSDVYFVVNSYRYYNNENDNIIPVYREDSGEFKPQGKCTDVAYFGPYANSFITIAAISMQDENKQIEKEVIAGSGQNIYASQNNLYVAEVSYNYENIAELFITENSENSGETTRIYKFSLEKGRVKYQGNGEVPGTIFNQFSMDEYKDSFRIATTKGHVLRSGGGSSNNIYVMDEDLKIIGGLEDLAPGERIYSARFMGERAYLVTFKKVDPLFVIDLSNPEKPEVLGKLKIPGYSDYLHPYDENHLIGIGKETVEAEEGDFAWYQGLKMAIFDVSDVENPKELHKVIIGDRGTDSEVLRDHKAFLFDKEKNLLVIPITLAVRPEGTPKSEQGNFVFQGAYVYDITLDDGFKLKGRVTHYDSDDVFKKSVYYFSGDSNIRRALYIDNILYTLSNGKIKLNSLKDLRELKGLNITSPQGA